MFVSKTQNVDETSEQFGEAVQYFKNHLLDAIRDVLVNNSKKGGAFTGVEEITVFFEWYGKNSFSGIHQVGDEMKLCLIDIFLKKKDYLEPKMFYKLFENNSKIELPELIYKGKLTREFIKSIINND